MIGLYIFLFLDLIVGGVLFYILVIKPKPKLIQCLMDEIKEVDSELRQLGLSVSEVKTSKKMPYYQNLLKEKINQLRIAYQNKKDEAYSHFGQEKDCSFFPQDTYSALGTVARNNTTLFYENSKTLVSHKNEIQILVTSYPHQVLYSFQGWTTRYSLYELLSSLKNSVRICQRFKNISLEKIMCWEIQNDISSTQRFSETAAGAVAGALLLGGLAGAVIGGMSSQKSYDKQDKRVLVLYVKQSNGTVGYEIIASVEKHGKESFKEMCWIFEKMLPDKKRKPRQIFDET